ncbi:MULTISPECIES: SP_0009 family protein [Streptococcus]|nr:MULTISPECIES: SP_0009 family protein [Streptococcus]VIV26985.1 putative extracellular protein [Streptococcus pneumoniae]
MENLLDVIEQFLSLSDEKLEELADKNQLLCLQEEKERKNA